MGHSKSSSKKEIHNIAGLSQNKGQILILTLYLKELEKEQQTKPKMSRRKEKLKIRAEINDRV